MSADPFETIFEDDPFASPRSSENPLLPPPKTTNKKSKQQQIRDKKYSFSDERPQKVHDMKKSQSFSGVFDPVPQSSHQQQFFRPSDRDLASMSEQIEKERMDAKAVWDVFALPDQQTKEEPQEEGRGENDDSSSADENLDAQLMDINKQIAEYEYKLRTLRDTKKAILAKRGDVSESAQSADASQAAAEKALQNLRAASDEESDKGNKEIVNAVVYMQEGTAMLKYGRRGYPHFRHFELSQDASEVRWYSGNKALNKTKIRLRNVLDISHGQKTDNFRRHAQPRLAKCSFSITYVNDGSSNSHTLDVVTKNRMDYLVWTQGLQKLAEAARKGRHETNLSLPTEIPVQIPVRNEGAIEKRLSLQPEPPIKSVERDLNSTKKKFLHLTKLARNPKVIQREEVENTLNQIASVEEIIENASSAYRSGRYSVASHEVWRANVEIQTMTDKLTILSKSK